MHVQSVFRQFQHRDWDDLALLDCNISREPNRLFVNRIESIYCNSTLLNRLVVFSQGPFRFQQGKRPPILLNRIEIRLVLSCEHNHNNLRASKNKIYYCAISGRPLRGDPRTVRLVQTLTIKSRIKNGNKRMT